MLTLSNVNSSVGGTYYCVVVNEAGFGTDTVNLYITPKIITHPMSSNYASAGMPSSALVCQADSFPGPQYRWEKLHSNGNYHVQPGKSYTLDFESVISYDDIGYYRCIAYTNVSSIINETASDPAIVSGKDFILTFT